MVDEKIYGRYEGESRQKLLEGSRLNWVMRGEKEAES